jgi:glycosyltransferase involved in cell wall biosynthesis
MLISFCIITTGNRPDKLRLCIKSIHRNFSSVDPYEIIVVGNNIDQFSDLDAVFIEDNEYVEFLGKRRNICTENSKGDILVHCDDDVVFPSDWYKKFLKFNNYNPNWRIMGNKVLLPDGSRYWDRATYLPNHKMVNYDFRSTDVTFYQSGCFCISRKSLMEEISWDDTIPFYAMFKGLGHNEDVDFSLRLKNKGIDIYFDKENIVWHNDFSYNSNNIFCNKTLDKNLIDYKSLYFTCLIHQLS